MRAPVVAVLNERQCSSSFVPVNDHKALNCSSSLLALFYYKGLTSARQRNDFFPKPTSFIERLSLLTIKAMVRAV
ncbi:hypothetical protein VNO78_35273 [Psophocarpus tetragonolobus]|uniref:Uncharacterized protein n=1 Tax=Psophocarpus tetragonolobus TaxID=3891 RepID=A0AAN9NNE6_PSOTE